MGDAVVAGNKPPDGVHLILHQGNQRRNHNGRTFHDKGGELVAQRFPASGRHQDESIVAVHKMRYDFFLISLECVETEEFLKFGMQFCRSYTHIISFWSI